MEEGGYRQKIEDLPEKENELKRLNDIKEILRFHYPAEGMSYYQKKYLKYKQKYLKLKIVNS